MMEPGANLAAELMGLTGRDAYVHAAIEMLLKLFPSDRLAWNSVDAGTGKAEVIGYPEADYVGMAEKVLATYEDHPLIVSFIRDGNGPRMWLPRRISDLATDRELHQTKAYRLVLAPVQSNRQLGILTGRLGTANGHAWVMNRRDIDFTENEVELAARVQPTLRLLDLAYGGGSREHALLPPDASGLTEREHEILQLLSKGLTGVAISHLLGISPRTVAKHLEHAYAKLGCTNRIDALRILRGE